MSMLMTLRIAFKALCTQQAAHGAHDAGHDHRRGRRHRHGGARHRRAAMIEDQVKSAGTNLVTVIAGSSNHGRRPERRGRQLPPRARGRAAAAQLARDRVRRRKHRHAGCSSSTAARTGTRASRGRTSTCRSSARGRSSTARSSPTKTSGRAAKVIVLGSNVSNTLFGENVDPTDIQIRVRNQVFRVLGVMSSKGAGGGGMNMDDQVFVPYTTVMKKLTGQTNIQRIYARPGRPTSSTTAAAAVTAALRTAHGNGARRGRLHRADARGHRGPPRGQRQHDDQACSRASRACRSSSAASAS